MLGSEEAWQGDQCCREQARAACHEADVRKRGVSSPSSPGGVDRALRRRVLVIAVGLHLEKPVHGAEGERPDAHAQKYLRGQRQPEWSDMEWQIRDWLYFTWLSGDFNVEQHIHSLDKMAWAMRDEYPVKATGVGGRQVRTAPDYGHIFDHHSVVYEYGNVIKAFSQCRQQNGCANDVSDHIMGTKGACDVMKHVIKGEKPWRFESQKVKGDMYQNEHIELIASIRAGKPINNGNYMSKSTLMAIMGRMATYTGKTITWNMAMNSKEDLSPPKYEFGSLAVPPVAMPGVTKFV